MMIDCILKYLSFGFVCSYSKFEDTETETISLSWNKPPVLNEWQNKVKMTWLYINISTLWEHMSFKMLQFFTDCLQLLTFSLRIEYSLAWDTLTQLHVLKLARLDSWSNCHTETFFFFSSILRYINHVRYFFNERQKCIKIALWKFKIALTRSKIVQISPSFAYMASFSVRSR